MLSEEKIRKMIRLSDYENGLGSTDLRRTRYNKTDYIRLQLLKTTVAIIIAAFLILLLIGICQIDYVMTHLFTLPFREISILGALGVLLAEIPALFVTGRMANRQYEESKMREKEYHATLEKLLALYEEEGQEESVL